VRFKRVAERPKDGSDGSKKAVQPELAPAVTPVVVEAPTVATEAVQPVAAPAVVAAPRKQEVPLMKRMLAWRERKVNGEGIEQRMTMVGKALYIALRRIVSGDRYWRWWWGRDTGVEELAGRLCGGDRSGSVVGEAPGTG
jgi:hypothetical protein